MKILLLILDFYCLFSYNTAFLASVNKDITWLWNTCNINITSENANFVNQIIKLTHQIRSPKISKFQKNRKKWNFTLLTSCKMVTKWRFSFNFEILLHGLSSGPCLFTETRENNVAKLFLSLESLMNLGHYWKKRFLIQTFF